MSIAVSDMTEKQLVAKLCVLCEQLWPEEWPGKYTGSREDLRDWLNEKTGLDVDHITNKESALRAWVTELENLANAS
jgi:hypothetical protein